jgi:hypothetical protein
MMRNLWALAPTAAAGWRHLHGKKSDVAWTFYYRAGGALAAAITSLHAWERTWFTQHFGAVSTVGGRANGALALANVEHVLSRRDAHYMAFFVNAANTAMNAFQERFLDLTGTAEAVARTTVELWIASAAVAAPLPGGGLRPPGRAERLMVCRGAERALGPFAARALSFTPDELSLPTTSGSFARAGLERWRNTEVALDPGGTPAWALFQEHTSAGINLTWMLNAWWLLPVHPEGDRNGAALRAALVQVLGAPSPTPTGDRFLITDPATVPAAALQAAGFERLLRAHLYVLTRSGVHRYYHYLADRYGEVGIKTAVRDGLRVRREQA